MGKHYLLNILNVDPILLIEMESFIEFIRPTLDECMADVVGETSYKFPGDKSGFTYLALLSSSHFSIHTWPENNCAAIDMFSCEGINAEALVSYVNKYFNPGSYDLKMINR